MTGALSAAEKRKLVSEVLAFVNRTRGEQGLGELRDLRHGFCEAQFGCSLSHSLSDDGEARVWARDGEWLFTLGRDEPPRPLPECARRFVIDFDAGLIPELEAKVAA